jgi:hypothetical protein
VEYHDGPHSDQRRTSQAIQEPLKTLRGLGGFLRETFGTIPEDLVGLLGGDRLKVLRAENLLAYSIKPRTDYERSKL